MRKNSKGSRHAETCWWKTSSSSGRRITLTSVSQEPGKTRTKLRSGQKSKTGSKMYTSQSWDKWRNIWKHQFKTSLTRTTRSLFWSIVKLTSSCSKLSSKTRRLLISGFLVCICTQSTKTHSLMKSKQTSRGEKRTKYPQIENEHWSIQGSWRSISMTSII